MLSFKSNFDKGLLLLSLPIKVWFKDLSDEPIIIVIPTIEQLFTQNDYNLFIEINTNKKEEYYKNNGRFIAENRLHLIMGLMTFFKERNIDKTLKKIFPNLTIENRSILFNNKKLSIEQFDLLVDMFLVGTNMLTIEEYQEKWFAPEIEDKYKQLMKEQAEKIKKAKTQGDREYKFDEALVCVLSYYPQFKIEDIKKMNQFTFFTLYSTALKRQGQFIMDVAAGNGLTKEHKPLF